MCRKPLKLGGLEHGCGKCPQCRINRRRLWVGRLLLESASHLEACSCTLTYSDEFGPVGPLVPHHLRNFLKRLRERVHPVPIRYFAVGEYGRKHGRAHYHVLLFGHNGSEVFNSWGLGYVDVKPCSAGAMDYVCAHTMKDLGFGKPRTDGRTPGFQRQSNRPGIGAMSLGPVVSWLESPEGLKFLKETGDVTRTFRTAGQTYAFGRYLTDRLRLLVTGATGMPKQVRESLIASFASETPAEKRRRNSRRINDGYRTAAMLRKQKRSESL